jgi:SAM-dependent methyltransferase
MTQLPSAPSPSAAVDALPDARGYVVDAPYTARYHDLQSPARIAYSIACAGFEHPVAPGAFRYAELGCGNGVTLAMLAALHPDSSFLGVDINPAHVASANELAAAAGLRNLVFLEADFAQAAALPWGAFDYITAHGVYAWVDTMVREQLLAFIARHLSVRGVACISYNAYPGWSAKEPLWRLIERHTRTLPGGSIERVSEGLRYLAGLRAAGIPYFAANPGAGELLDYLLSEDLRYVAHEFCNRHFAPCYCEDVFAEARRHGLHFMAQAETRPNLPFERVPAGCEHLLAATEGLEARESLASLLRHEAFRSDLYVRERPAAIAIESSPLWDRIFTNLVPMRDIGPVIACGARSLERADPLVDALLRGCESGEQTLRFLGSLPTVRRFSPGAVLETAQRLELSGCFGFLPTGSDQTRATGAGRVGADPDGADGQGALVWRFGSSAVRVLLERGLHDSGFGSLAAPRLGSALRMTPTDVLALLSLDGRTLTVAAPVFTASLNGSWPDILAYRVDQVWARDFLEDFRDHWGPVLRKLGVVVPV